MSEKCMLCQFPDEDTLRYGELLRKNGRVVHTFCLYLSSNLQQRGDDDDVFLGFLMNDIQAEQRRVKSLVCCYCGRGFANIGCCARKCRRVFHLICGIKNGAENRFIGSHQSFCDRHVTKERYRPDSDELCCICCDRIQGENERFSHVMMIRAPCCANGWFHKYCLQHFANTSGYFFKCPLCNDTSKFPLRMRQSGIFIPLRDAAWELEPHAFEELNERPSTCAASPCLNKKGRNESNRRNPILLCMSCGSIAIHQLCLPMHCDVFTCNDCKETIGGDSVLARLPAEAETHDAVDVLSSKTEADKFNGLGTKRKAEASDDKSAPLPAKMNVLESRLMEDSSDSEDIVVSTDQGRKRILRITSISSSDESNGEDCGRNHNTKSSSRTATTSRSQDSNVLEQICIARRTRLGQATRNRNACIARRTRQAIASVGTTAGFQRYAHSRVRREAKKIVEEEGKEDVDGEAEEDGEKEKDEEVQKEKVCGISSANTPRKSAESSSCGSELLAKAFQRPDCTSLPEMPHKISLPRICSRRKTIHQEDENDISSTEPSVSQSGSDTQNYNSFIAMRTRRKSMHYSSLNESTPSATHPTTVRCRESLRKETPNDTPQSSPQVKSVPTRRKSIHHALLYSHRNEPSEGKSKTLRRKSLFQDSPQEIITAQSIRRKFPFQDSADASIAAQSLRHKALFQDSAEKSITAQSLRRKFPSEDSAEASIAAQSIRRNSPPQVSAEDSPGKSIGAQSLRRKSLFLHSAEDRKAQTNTEIPSGSAGKVAPCRRKSLYQPNFNDKSSAQYRATPSNTQKSSIAPHDRLQTSKESSRSDPCNEQLNNSPGCNTFLGQEPDRGSRNVSNNEIALQGPNRNLLSRSSNDCPSSSEASFIATRTRRKSVFLSSSSESSTSESDHKQPDKAGLIGSGAQESSSKGSSTSGTLAERSQRPKSRENSPSDFLGRQLDCRTASGSNKLGPERQKSVQTHPNCDRNSSSGKVGSVRQENELHDSSSSCSSDIPNRTMTSFIAARTRRKFLFQTSSSEGLALEYCNKQPARINAGISADKMTSQSSSSDNSSADFLVGQHNRDTAVGSNDKTGRSLSSSDCGASQISNLQNNAESSFIAARTRRKSAYYSNANESCIVERPRRKSVYYGSPVPRTPPACSTTLAPSGSSAEASSSSFYASPLSRSTDSNSEHALKKAAVSRSSLSSSSKSSTRTRSKSSSNAELVSKKDARAENPPKELVEPVSNTNPSAKCRLKRTIGPRSKTCSITVDSAQKETHHPKSKKSSSLENSPKKGVIPEISASCSVVKKAKHPSTNVISSTVYPTKNVTEPRTIASSRTVCPKKTALTSNNMISSDAYPAKETSNKVTVSGTGTEAIREILEKLPTNLKCFNRGPPKGIPKSQLTEKHTKTCIDNYKENQPEGYNIEETIELLPKASRQNENGELNIPKLTKTDSGYASVSGPAILAETAPTSNLPSWHWNDAKSSKSSSVECPTKKATFPSSNERNKDQSNRATVSNIGDDTSKIAEQAQYPASFATVFKQKKPGPLRKNPPQHPASLATFFKKKKPGRHRNNPPHNTASGDILSEGDHKSQQVTPFGIEKSLNQNYTNSNSKPQTTEKAHKANHKPKQFRAVDNTAAPSRKLKPLDPGQTSSANEPLVASQAIVSFAKPIREHSQRQSSASRRPQRTVESRARNYHPYINQLLAKSTAAIHRHLQQPSTAQPPFATLVSLKGSTNFRSDRLRKLHKFTIEMA